MAGMGPAPNPNRQRRNATVPMTRLPAEGRTGRTPAWPLLDDVRLSARRDVYETRAEQLRVDLVEKTGAARAALQRKLEELEVEIAVLNRQLEVQRGLEKKLWRELWRAPQAVAWERLGWTRDVAQYVRWKVLAELGDLDAAKEARQLSDRIGLTPLAMLRLRWEIVTEEETARRTRRPPAASPKQEPAKGQQPPETPGDPRAALYAV